MARSSVPKWARLGFRSESAYRRFRETPEFSRAKQRAERSARVGATKGSKFRRALELSGRKEYPTSRRQSHRGEHIYQVVITLQTEKGPITMALEFDHSPSLQDIHDAVPRVWAHARSEYDVSAKVTPEYTIIGEVELVP